MMMGLKSNFVLVKNVLSGNDLEYLIKISKYQLESKGIPCYSLIESLDSECFRKIKTSVESSIGCKAEYLNDFYMYTDTSAKASWHMDTELFTFSNSVNAWILLSPGEIESPLSIMSEINTSSQNTYHTVSIDDDQYHFLNLTSGAQNRYVEADLGVECSPAVEAGDVLLFDSGMFHRTNTNLAKHCHITKFVVDYGDGLLSKRQVPEIMWPEIAMYNKIIKNNSSSEGVINAIRRLLETDEGKDALSAGFYPERFDMYRYAVSKIAAKV